MTARRFMARLHTLRIPWVTMVLVVLCAGFVAAESAALFMRIRSAPVRSKPSLKDGGQDGVLYAGQQVQVIDRSKDGDWVKIRFTHLESSQPSDTKAETVTEKGQKEGWVHATLLSEKAPALEAPAAARWLETGGESLRKKASADAPSKADAYAAARKVDAKVLSELEQRYPTADELDKFLREGRLGVYRDDWPSLEGGVTK
ncbi:MAG: SH3 domain-containing protein [Planctomycetes bacterium]|nr:SH3 domain-containing protein [Planctomycetota bacterium]